MIDLNMHAAEMINLKKCCICPRNCGVDRTAGITGVCGMTDRIRISRAALHFWEEPCISGYYDGQEEMNSGLEISDIYDSEHLTGNKKRGSGAVFFTGCNLGCIYCQNADISGIKKNCNEDLDNNSNRKNQDNLTGNGKDNLSVREKPDMMGKEVTAQELSDIFLRLQNVDHAYNINLVTGVHFVPQIAEALKIAREKGLVIPVIYNSSGYEKVETLKLLEGLVDVYLPDMKYISKDLAAEYSRAADYPEVSMAAIDEMYRQVGDAEFYEINDESKDEDFSGADPGNDSFLLIKKGMIVRNLLLPGHVKESERVIKYLYEKYGDNIYISIMSQYTPMPHMKEHPLLGRRVTKREYERLLDYAVELGITNAFIQDRHVAKESFVPEWNLK